MPAVLASSTRQFQAMACPCEVLVDTDDLNVAQDILDIASQEAWRIEAKISRYKKGTITDQINTSAGNPVLVDDETAKLIDYADQCFHLSDGLFDITSGVLRKIWTFDGRSAAPSQKAIEETRRLIGWEKVRWTRPVIQVPFGMEIDLGGIGKEYAVDRALGLIRARFDIGVLVNFGGDMAVGGKRRRDLPWTVGIENIHRVGDASRIIQVKRGALATSGDTRKFVSIEGKRFGHILDPRTGWPVAEAPRSVTVAARTCSQAGFLSTVAILKGKNAEDFLNEAGVRFWSFR